MTDQTAASDDGLLYAEDIPVGWELDLGTYEMTEEEILEFGRRWDPLPFHVDPQVAVEWPVGGLIASAVHTMAALQSLQATAFTSRLALVAGKAFEEVRLKVPVRPGDVLRGHLTVLDMSLRERRGDLTTGMSMRNQDGVEVLSARGVAVIRRRDTA